MHPNDRRPEPGDLLALPDVMRRLNIGRTTVWRMSRDGRLRSVKVGRALRFRPEDVDRFILDNMTPVVER